MLHTLDRDGACRRPCLAGWAGYDGGHSALVHLVDPECGGRPLGQVAHDLVVGDVDGEEEYVVVRVAGDVLLPVL